MNQISLKAERLYDARYNPPNTPGKRRDFLQCRYIVAMARDLLQNVNRMLELTDSAQLIVVELDQSFDGEEMDQLRKQMGFRFYEMIEYQRMHFDVSADPKRNSPQAERKIIVDAFGRVRQAQNTQMELRNVFFDIQKAYKQAPDKYHDLQDLFNRCGLMTTTVVARPNVNVIAMDISEFDDQWLSQLERYGKVVDSHDPRANKPPCVQIVHASSASQSKSVYDAERSFAQSQNSKTVTVLVCSLAPGENPAGIRAIAPSVNYVFTWYRSTGDSPADQRLNDLKKLNVTFDALDVLSDSALYPSLLRQGDPKPVQSVSDLADIFKTKLRDAYKKAQLRPSAASDATTILD